MNLKSITTAMAALAFVATAFFGNAVQAATEGGTPVYDESAYTQYVESTMKKMNKLYLQFCGTCGVSGAKAAKARQEYYQLSRDLMQHMNAKFDNLDPKKGAALSPTEVLVNIHALTMLVDMLTATQMEFMADNEHIVSK
jgi:hypothetical protein